MAVAAWISRGMTEHSRRRDDRTLVQDFGFDWRLSGYLMLLLRHLLIQDLSCQTCKLCPLGTRPDWGMTETAVRRAITSANTYQHYNRDDPLSQQRRGKLLAMFWLDGASLYLVSVYMMASRIYKFLKIQNFNLNINLSLEPPFPTALPLSAAFNGVLLFFTLKHQ